MFLFYCYYDCIMVMIILWLCLCYYYVMIILFTCFSYDMTMTNGLLLRASLHSLWLTPGSEAYTHTVFPHRQSPSCCRTYGSGVCASHHCRPQLIHNAYICAPGIYPTHHTIAPSWIAMPRAKPYNLAPSHQIVDLHLCFCLLLAGASSSPSGQWTCCVACR